MAERTETAATAAADEVGARVLSDAEIVLPSREVMLTSGRRIVVRPWGMARGALLLERLQALQPVLAQHQNATVNELLSIAWDEIVGIVSVTIDVPVAEMTRDPQDGGLTFEDLLSLTEAILEVCIVRADGRGAVPLLIALVKQLTTTVAQTIGPLVAQQRSSASAKADTSTARSPNGSASPNRGRRGKGRH